jgi:adenine-specific DNA-methyltransferase
MTDEQTKKEIQEALSRFASGNLLANATHLLDVIGYRSTKAEKLEPNNLTGFREQLDPQRQLNTADALADEWQSVDFVFQLTDVEVRNASLQTSFVFESSGVYDRAHIESYLFFAIRLRGTGYTRMQLARATRAINKLFPMPVMVLFLYDELITLAVIRRRLNLRDESRDVLGKVTLIKDITYADPLRAHIDILHDLSFDALYDEYRFQNFVQLHEAWEKRLSSYALTERFYREIADWYFWAQSREDVILPRSIGDISDDAERAKQRSLFFIRLLTRLIFCWFLQEKRLIPRDLFRERVARDLLIDFAPGSGTYYRAVLQNLFFATLNQEQARRDWRKTYEGSRDGNRGVTNLWRYRDLLRDPQRLEVLLREGIPFVNGGLFDCLDKVYDQKGQPNERWDDFSQEKNNFLRLPNELFFGADRTVDLSDVYEDPRRRREKVRPLIEILSHYKFTVEENTPLEEEIALDPELLGKVFENLLASYNEDTKSTARKALGAFYTPREIVDYMVDESLIAYLEKELGAAQPPGNGAPGERGDQRVRELLRPSTEARSNPFSVDESRALIAAIGRVKILDPACGSGAFPMGALHRLVDLLRTLDPNNESWKSDRLQDAQRYRETLLAADASAEELAQTDERIADIRRSFESPFHALDFARKLYLIEDGIYGVDIQPLACQIAKLRFFIALLVDQRVDRHAANLGVRPLPNLDTKIVAADSLRPVEKPLGQMQLLETVLRPLQQKLAQVRHEHFNARTPATKLRCRELDEHYRREIADLIVQAGLPGDTAEMLAEWNPYDPNVAADFFDPEWMFGSDAKSGFDIVIGNPPYIRIQTLNQKDPELTAFYKEHYESAKKGNYDLYVVFVEAGLNLLKPDGQLAFILPHKFFNAQYGEPLRGLIAKGRYLRHVVHFGDQQVFPGATNYVCLLFLSKAGVPAYRFMRVNDLQEWLRTFKATEETLSARTVGPSEWNIVVGRGADVFKRLQELPNRLITVADTFVGVQTDADDVFIVEVLREEAETLVCRSSYTGDEHRLEKDHLKPLLKGSVNVRRYAFSDLSKRLIFPYETVEGASRLIPVDAYKRKFPLTWAYLWACKTRLEPRGGGRLGPEWYGYVYKKNHTRFEQPKLVVPSLGETACFAADLAGRYYFVGSGGGGGGGYGITLKPNQQVGLLGLLGILNSTVSTYYLRQVSTSFRGGYFALNRQYIEQLPIVIPSERTQAIVVRVVEYLVWLYQVSQDRGSAILPRERLMTSYYDQMLNALVYELFFPTELHARGLHISDLVGDAGLPPLGSIPEAQRSSQLLQAFGALYDSDHPLRAALYGLGSLETVRLIEGQR